MEKDNDKRTRPLVLPSLHLPFDKTELKCMYANSQNTKDQSSTKACCDNRYNDVRFAVCLNCQGNDTTTTCFSCNEDLANVINKEVKSRAKKGYIKLFTPATEILSQVDWGDTTKDPPPIITIGSQKTIGLVKDKEHNNVFHWVGGCPLCQERRLPPQPPNPTLPPPNIETIRLPNVKSRHINTETFDIENIITNVELVICHPIISTDEEEMYTHKYMHAGEGNAVIFHSKPKWFEEGARVLVKKEDDNGTYTAICGMYYKGGIATDINDIQALGKLVVDAAPTPLKRGGGRKQGDFRTGSRRENRRNGAHGNSNDQFLLDVRASKASKYLCGSNCRESRVCIQLAYMNQGTGLVDYTPLYYRAAKSSTFKRNPVGNGPAVLSCEAEGRQVAKQIDEMADTDKQQKVINVLTNFQLPRKQLALLYIDLLHVDEVKKLGIKSISQLSSNNIIKSWNQTRACLDGYDIADDEITDTIEDLDMLSLFTNNPPPYQIGDAVFVFKNDEWLPAIIVAHHGVNASDGNIYLVDYGTNRQELFGQFDISGEPGENQWSDIDRDEPNTKERLKWIRKRIDNGCNNMPVLFSINGMFTQYFATIGGHFDQ